VACGPDATPGYCIFHDDMDRVYALLERAHAVVVGSPVYFDSVSGPLKLLMDRCNCLTPLVTLADGSQDFVPKWPRTRRGAFVTSCSSKHRYDRISQMDRGALGGDAGVAARGQRAGERVRAAAGAGARAGPAAGGERATRGRCSIANAVRSTDRAESAAAGRRERSPAGIGFRIPAAL
jgi:hypothetical protein